MIEVDRETERRNGCLQFVLLAGVFAVLLYLATPDKWLFAAILPVLLIVVGYRSWAVERFSPTLSQYYGRAVVAGGADAILGVLGTEEWLRDTWAQAGARLPRLLGLPSDRLATAMKALRRDHMPPRHLPGPWHVVNRLAVVSMGVALGGTLSWAATRISCSRTLPALLEAVTWPLWAGLVLVVVFRLVVAASNRRQLARVTEAMRTNTSQELKALLDPPWRARRVAVLAELDRLGLHAEGVAPALPVPELRIVDLLLTAGVAGAFLAGLVVGSC